MISFEPFALRALSKSSWLVASRDSRAAAVMAAAARTFVGCILDLKMLVSLMERRKIVEALVDGRTKDLRG